jgi:REP-associated tyrosine transposase
VGELCFFNPYADIRLTANRLPHWQQEGAVYFVTFRLADAVPHRLRTQWESEREAWLRVYPQPWSVDVEREYHERFSGAIERWLDAGNGSCVLRREDCARIVAEALRYFDGERLAHFICSNAKSCACAIRAKRELAFGKAVAQLEELQLAEN